MELKDFLKPTQEELFSLLLQRYKGKAFFCKGSFILVKGEIPALLVAHLDTVHKNPIKEICTSADGNILMSPQGIGGDDRCGVYALAKIYETAEKKPFLLFTCDEEIGGIGARSFCKAHQQKQLPAEVDNFKIIIEIDRKGKNDAVYYSCDNPDFEEYITSKGFITEWGTFSDISVIAPELGTAAVNLSSGYYDAHTQHEYINCLHLEKTIRRVESIIADASKEDFPKYEYIEEIWDGYSYFDAEEREKKFLLADLPNEFWDSYDDIFDYCTAAEIKEYKTLHGKKWAEFLCRDLAESLEDYDYSVATYDIYDE